MDERMIRRRLKLAIVFVVAIGIGLLLVCGILAVYLRNTIRQAADQQMQAETEEYISRINKQIDADFQILETLAIFIGQHSSYTSEAFGKTLDEANGRNDFVSMLYFPAGGDGIASTIGQALRTDVPLQSLHIDAQETIQRALSGEASVSRLYESEYSDERVFLYSVPVYSGGSVTGALAAIDQVEIFSDILTGNAVMGGSGYIHMLGTEGRYLIRSSRSVVQEPMETIFDGPFFSPEEVQDIQAAMSRQESVFSFFQYQGHTYQCLLEPVGINGWYLICVNTMQNSIRAAYQIMRVMGIAFAGILSLIVFLLVYGYYAIRRNNRELIYLAYHDRLTGADNRARFAQRITACLQQRQAFSLVALNVRNFKFLNEIFGKEYADRLLCYIKASLEQHMNPAEFFCRDSADLFYLCLKQTNRDELRARLESLMEEIVQITERSHSDYRLRLYCGIVIADQPGKGSVTQQITDLMAHALFALASARGSYHNSLWFYDAQLHEQEKLENYIESHMQQALEKGGFKLYLQPKFDLKTQSLGGAEALVRWAADDGRVIYPDQFIPLFEHNGFCARLDLYMVDCVCRQLRQWIDMGLKPVGVSVNQSKLLFYESDYIENLTRLVDQYAIPAKLITLEILEGLALENVEELNAKIERLQASGFRVSMDDFGSGYSSLNTLGRLSINEVKLDRGFLLEIAGKPGGRTQLVMSQVVELARRLGMDTVVEGVETQADEALVQAMGCDYGQGYYYSRPLPAADFTTKFMTLPSLPSS